MAEFMRGATVPSVTLDDDEARAYASRMPRIMRASRLNSHYPNASGLGGHIGVMNPDVHRGLHKGLEVDERTGLPTYKAFTKVQSDAAVAANQLNVLGSREVLERKAARDPEGIYAKQLAKYDYYSQLVNADQIPLGHMEVRYRKRDNGRDYFNVSLDKLDVSGVFVRYAIDCSQVISSSDQIAKVDEREVAQHTDSFRSLIYQFTSLDAEFTLVKLASMAGLDVERVVKGTVGPFYFPFTNTPDVFAEFVEKHGFIATFGLDMAANDVTDDRNNDPLTSFIMKTVSDEVAEGYGIARQRIGYKVFKDRKFVCARAGVNELREIIKGLGCNTIIYGV